LGDFFRLTKVISHNGRDLGDYTVYFRLISQEGAD